MLVLMVAAYGYPIGQFFFLKAHSVPAIEVTSAASSATIEHVDGGGPGTLADCIIRGR